MKASFSVHLLQAVTVWVTVMFRVLSTPNHHQQWVLATVLTVKWITLSGQFRCSTLGLPTTSPTPKKAWTQGFPVWKASLRSHPEAGQRDVEREIMIWLAILWESGELNPGSHPLKPSEVQFGVDQFEGQAGECIYPSACAAHLSLAGLPVHLL